MAQAEVTFFAIPKPFAGPFADIQWNAIGSWAQVAGAENVVLVGDDAGVAEAAAAFGARHVSTVARNEHGTPLLDAAFAAAHGQARERLLCYVNADIVMTPRVLEIAATVARSADSFVIVGDSMDAAVESRLAFDDGWVSRVDRISAEGRPRGVGALDWFLFSGDLYRDLPPFAVGRVGFDNWLVWKACADGAAVVDATRFYRPLHQSHDYSHLASGRAATLYGSDEGDRNLELAGGWEHIYTREHATHLLTHRGRLRRHLGRGALLLWRRARYKLDRIGRGAGQGD